MANPERTSSPQTRLGFFTPNAQRQPIVKQGQFKPQCVDFGAGVSSCYLAVAASLLDKLATGHKLASPDLKNLLKKHNSLFPEQMVTKGAAFNPQDRIELLLDKVKTGILTQSLAKTLFELAQDAINNDPTAHALYLADRNDSQRFTSFVLATLAKTLHINIHLLEKTQDKNIPKKINIDCDGSLTISLRYQQDRVMSLIKQPERAGRLQKMVLKNDSDFEMQVNESSVYAMQNTLGQIISVYQKEKQSLMLMVNANELSDTDLITLYSKLLTSELEKNEQPLVGAMGDARQIVQVIMKQSTSFQEEAFSDTQSLIINTIASLASLNKVDMEMAFEQMESNKNNATRPAIS